MGIPRYRCPIGAFRQLLVAIWCITHEFSGRLGSRNFHLLQRGTCPTFHLPINLHAAFSIRVLRLPGISLPQNTQPSFPLPHRERSPAHGRVRVPANLCVGVVALLDLSTLLIPLAWLLDYEHMIMSMVAAGALGQDVSLPRPVRQMGPLPLADLFTLAKI